MSQFIGGPTRHWKQVTTHDTNPVFTDGNNNAVLFQWVYVGATAGNLVIIKENGTTETVPVAANSYHPLMGEVITTASTAALIFAARI